MKEKLRNHINLLFTDAPNSQETSEVKEELLANLIEHYNDQKENGKSDEEAYAVVISNIGDVRELIKNLQDSCSIEGTVGDGNFEDTNKKEDTYNSDKSRSIGSMIDDFITNIGSAFEMDCSVVNDKSYSSIGIHTINIAFISESIRFYLHDEEKIRIVEYMSKKPSLNELATVDLYNSECNIKNGKRLFFVAKSKVDIYLPRTYHGNLNIKVTSSSIKLDELLELNNVTLKGVSCSVKGKGICSENIDIHVASGSIKLDVLKGHHRLATESGAIHVDKICGGGECKTTSGSIHLLYEEMEENLSISVVSGSVRLSVPKEISFYYNASAVSGSIHTCFNTTQYSSSRHSIQGSVGETPDKNINIKAISGNIWIQNNENR